MDIKVRQDDFLKAISGINTAINEVLKVEKRLKSSNEHLKECWEGDCKDKYYSQYKKIADKFTDYKTCLEGMKSDLNIISNKFQEVDRELNKQINISGKL